MNAATYTERRDADIRQIKERILSVLPAATYEMDRFFQFMDIDFSDRTETACVEVGPQPRLHVNPGFVRRFCKRQEHLLMLVLHEIYHVILGHTRLFPRVTEADNIAFDAVINSLLCRQFRDPQYLDFFCRLNPTSRFPNRLLRPPRGWPTRPAFARDVPPRERSLMQMLYGPAAGSVTYRDVLDLLREIPLQPDDPASNRAGPCRSQANARIASDYVLLGDHGGSRGSGRMDEAAVGDSVLKDVLRRITGNWPSDATLRIGRGQGEKPFDFLMPAPLDPRREFLVALRGLLTRAGVLRPEPGSPYAWKRVATTVEAVSVVPNWRDRHAHSRAALLGATPLLFSRDVEVPHLRWRPREVAHVYVDISGSMASHLPWLVGALAPLHRRGSCRLFGFSTVVAPLSRSHLLERPIRNTFGTDISCVYAHFLGLPGRAAPRKVVVLTDGYTGRPGAEQTTAAAERKVRVFVGVVGGRYVSDLQGQVFQIHVLPKLN